MTVSAAYGDRPVAARGQLDDLGAVLAHGVAQPQVEDRELVLDVRGQGDDQRRGRRLVDGGPGQAEDGGGGQAVAQLGVDVVGAERQPGHLGPGVGVLVGEPGAADHGQRRPAAHGLGRRPAPRRPRPGPRPSWPRPARRPGGPAAPTPAPGSVAAAKAKRPLSHSQPQLTGSESTPISRVSSPELDCTATRQPTEHVVQVLSTCSRSQGRALKR